MLKVKFTNATSAILYNDSTSAVITPENGVFTVTEPLSKNDQDYYHFIITGENVKVSGYIDSVTEKQQYINLFKDCTQITDASDLILSAPNMKQSCYANMFIDCTNLTTPPQIQAQNLDIWCFQNMFAGCEKLSTAPVLSATNLAPYCYYCMFYGCKSLSSAPNLPARTLADWCYNSMFYNCSSLTGISASFSAWTETGTKNWVTNVAPSGNFVNNNVDRIYSNDNVPVGWIDWNKEPLTFKAIGGPANISINSVGSPTYLVTVRYAKNGQEYSDYTIGNVIELNENEFVKFSGANENFSRRAYGYYIFAMTGSIEANGNIQSLLNFSDVAPSGCFGHLFDSCTSLVTAPNLPATEIGIGCYQDMFSGCVNLSAAPTILPAIDLAQSCYGGMFRNTGIKYAPELPATGLAEYCYDFMFEGCSKLLEAPYLPATNINFERCYGFMFDGCRSLTSISVNFEEWIDGATYIWVRNVAPTGIFTKPSTLSANYSYWSGIPDGWTVNNIDA